MTPLLSITNLSKSFGGLRALDGVDFDVNEGDITGLIGPNGAGKSTLFNVITGFYRPDNGIVEYRGENIVRLRPDQIARKGIGRVFQMTMLFRGTTALESLIIGAYPRERTGFWQALFDRTSYREEEEASYQKALDVLELTGITEWKDRLVETVPYGVQRRLAVAQILMSEPQLLLLDEPLSGLSEEEITEILDVIRQLSTEGRGIIIIEHHMRGVMTVCERIVVFNYGKKIAEGTPVEIRSNPEVIKAYLGSEGGGSGTEVTRSP